MKVVAELAGMVRATREDLLAEAERLDLWAAGTEAQLGGRETTRTALVRFRAAVLRLGAALLGAPSASA